MPRSPDSSPSGTFQAWTLPVLALLAGLWLVPVTIMGPDFSRMPGEPCDSGFSSYVLEHGYRWMTGREPSLFGAPFAYPFERSITLSDNFISTLPAYGACRLLGLDREGAYQAWFLTLFVLNYLCAWWALRKLDHPPGLSALGAFLFAFMAPVLEEVTHPALLHLFPIPLAVAGFVLWARTGSVRAFAGMCAAVVLQFYGAFYLGTFLSLSLAAFGLSWLAIHRRIGGGWSLFTLEKLALCAAAAVLSLLPLALPYMETASANGFTRFWRDVLPQLPTASDLFLANPGNLLWGFTSDRSGILSFNNAMHMGILPWAGVIGYLALLARGRGSRAVTAALLVPVALTLLCMRFGDFSLFKLVQWLPVFKSMRALTRVVLVDAFFIILVLLWTARVFLGSIRNPAAAKAAFAALFLVAAADQHNTLLAHYGYEKTKRAAEVDAVREDLARAAAGARVAAYLPAANASAGDCRVTVAAMLAAQDLGKPIVNAYTSWFPKGYGFFYRTDRDSLDEWMLRTQAASDEPLWKGLVLAGPGARGVSVAVPAGREEARGRLLEAFRASGAKKDLPWILGLKGFDVLGSDELWMGRRGEVTLSPGEMLTLEGVSFIPQGVRMLVDGKPSGTLFFSGEPTRVTLAGRDRPTLYTLIPEKTFTNYYGGLEQAFPEVSVIFTKVRFELADSAPAAKP
ncbi:MAG: hypothetical protein ACOZEN_04350 [Thermodesulfobacteriota bacterium]